MRITQWGEFGVHFVTFIARREREGAKMVTAGEIAKAQNIALDYTQQILQRLRKGALVDSIRGPQGGYRLSRPAGAITLLDILVATEGDTFELICDTKPIDSDRCGAEHHCGLRIIWGDLKNHVNGFLQNYSVETLLAAEEPGPVQIGHSVVKKSAEAGLSEP